MVRTAVKSNDAIPEGLPILFKNLDICVLAIMYLLVVYHIP